MREFSNSITIGWCGVATGASPSRRDIEPTDIPYLLSGIVLLDVHYDPLDFEYRLIGGEVVKRSGNLKGKRVRQASLLNVASMGLPQLLRRRRDRHPAIPRRDGDQRLSSRSADAA